MKKMLKEKMYDIHICLPEKVMNELKKQAEESFTLLETYTQLILAFALIICRKKNYNKSKRRKHGIFHRINR